MVICVLAGVGLVVVKPAYRVFKGWRLDRNLSAARVAVDADRMSEARDLSLTVLRAGEPGIEAFRILEKSMASLRDLRHADVARALITHPDGSDEDRLKGFRGLVPEVPLGLAGQAWSALPEESRGRPEFASVFAERLISAGRSGEAANVLLGVPEAQRTPAVEQGLIRVLIRSGKGDGYDEAQRRLAALWPASGAGAGGWLDLLEEIPPLSLRPNLLGRVVESLGRSGGEDPVRAALMMARIEYAGNFPGRADVLERAVASCKDEAPVALAGFLDALGLHRLLLENCPPELVAEHPELFPLVLGAMQKSGDWEQIPPLLEAHGTDLPKAELLAQRALVAAGTGDSAGRVREWNAAMGEARTSSGNGFLRLHEIAHHAGLEAEAGQAMLEAIRLGRGPLPLYEDLKFLLNPLASQGRENDLMQICAIYLPFEPGNPVLLTQYAYLACLNGLADGKTIVAALKPMAEAFPDALPIQCVLATAYLSDGQPVAAAETLDRLKLDPEKLAPGYRAVFLTTQVLNQRLSRDDPAITGFPWKSLLPSERRKFSEWIKRDPDNVRAN